MLFATIHAGQQRTVTSFGTLRYRLPALLVLTIALLATPTLDLTRPLGPWCL